MSNIKKLTPFKYFALTNFPYIEADFDALTNYELFCKIVEYVNSISTSQNEVIDAFNEFTESITSAWEQYSHDLTEEWETYKAYVDSIKDDLQEAVNTKLDEMALDGSLEEIIAPLMPDLINDWLDNHPEATTTVLDHSLSFNKLIIGTLGFVTPEMYGAVGDGVTDDSDAFIDAVTSGYPVYLIGNYGVSFNTNLITLSNLDKLTIYGTGTVINISETIPETDIALIRITNSKNINITMNYVGVSTFSVPNNIGYGESVIRLENCENITADLHVKNCRYGLVCGAYNTKNNLSKNIKLTGTAYNMTYFVALYGAENIEIDCVCDTIHRSVYLGGCENFIVKNIYNHQYSADVNVIITNEYKNNIMQGCINGTVICSEFNNASHTVTESKNAGISIGDTSRTEDLDATLKFSNITFDIDVNSASGAFGVVGASGLHEIIMNDIFLKISTHEQGAFTSIRFLANVPFKGFITLKDSNIINYGALLLGESNQLLLLDHSKLNASSATKKANIVAINNSFVTGLFTAIVDESSGFAYSNLLNSIAYKNGNLMTQKYYSNIINDSLTVSGGDIIMLENPAIVELESNGVTTNMAGSVFTIPSGTYLLKMINGIKTIICVA